MCTFVTIREYIMIDKINENILMGKYTDKFPINSSTAYIAGNHGWTDYFLDEQIIFSHRKGYIAEDLHSHNYYELIICAAGKEMQYVADNQYLSVKPGTVILTKPMSVHIYRPLATVSYDRYVIYFKPSLNIFSDKSIMNFFEKGNESNLYISQSHSICQYAKKAEEELLNTNSPYSVAKALLQICNIFICLSETEVENAKTNISNIPDYLYEIKEFIDREYSNINTITELAGKFHYSREYITRGFNSYFNTSLYEYILKRKLLRCCNLLIQGESVEKSARLSGFNNLSGFTRMFKKYNGCTPSEYKERNK